LPSSFPECLVAALMADHRPAGQRFKGKLRRPSFQSADCEAPHTRSGRPALSIAGGLPKAEDSNHDDAAKDGLVVQVRDLRPFPGDLPQPAEPAPLKASPR
jgi:hypothetical protein